MILKTTSLRWWKIQTSERQSKTFDESFIKAYSENSNKGWISKTLNNYMSYTMIYNFYLKELELRNLI